MHAKSLQLCPTLQPYVWTMARQAPLSMGFSRQECWSGVPLPPPGNLPYPGLLRLLHCREILYTEPLGKSLKTTVLAHSSTTFKYILRICAPSFYLVCQSSTICWTFFQLLGLQYPKKTKFLPSTLVEETDNKLSEFDSVPHWAWHGMDMAVRNGKLRLLLILKHCCLVSPVTCKGRGYWDLHPKFPLHQAEYQAHNRLSMQIWLISWVKLQVKEIVFIFPKCLTQLSFKGEIL